MSLSELLKKREITKVEPDPNSAARLFNAANSAIAAAKDNVKMRHNDVALSLAYHAMLNAGRALMASKGYRAFSETHHKTTVAFCAAVLPQQGAQLVVLFNRYRVRRHDIVYGEIEEGSVGDSEAQTAITKAEEFLALVKTKF